MRFLLRFSFLSLAMLALALPGQAQVSGNQVTGNSRRARYQEPGGGERLAGTSSRTFLTDSTFVLGASVMQHMRADSYVAVFGLRQEAPTIAVAEKRLVARVQRFTGRLRRLGVESKDVYTDIITQQRIKDVRSVRQNTDLAAAGFEGEEYFRSFESTRNVVVSFRRIAALDDMLVAAAADSIYDLVKVDYIVNQPETVYDNLFRVAAEVINHKKANYLLLTGAQLHPTSEPYAEQFDSYVPAGQYQAYEAVIATPYTYDYSNRQHKGLRALTTYYYSPPSADGFDRVINPVVIEPAVTYTLALQVKYTLQKPGRK